MDDKEVVFEYSGNLADASTYYAKAFCVKCLVDRNRTGGVWRNRMFFCWSCK